MTENRTQGINDRRGRTEKGRSADLMTLEAHYSEINEKAICEPKFYMEEGLKRTIALYKKFF